MRKKIKKCENSKTERATTTTQLWKRWGENAHDNECIGPRAAAHTRGKIPMMHQKQKIVHYIFKRLYELHISAYGMDAAAAAQSATLKTRQKKMRTMSKSIKANRILHNQSLTGQDWQTIRRRLILCDAAASKKRSFAIFVCSMNENGNVCACRWNKWSKIATNRGAVWWHKLGLPSAFRRFFLKMFKQSFVICHGIRSIR